MSRAATALVAIAAAAWTVASSVAGAAILQASNATEHVKTRLIAEQGTVAPGEHLWILLQQQMQPGWHTYWRNPGDTGQATTIVWHLPAGVQAGAVQWPVPQRFVIGPLVNYGYEGDVGLLSELSVPSNWPAGQPLQIAADVSWLVCADLCVPENASFTLSVPTSSGAATAAAGGAIPGSAVLFAAARSSLPQASAWPASISAATKSVQVHVAMPAAAAQGLVDAQFYPSVPGVIDALAQQTFGYRDGALTITAPRGDQPAPTVVDGLVLLTRHGASGRERLVLGFPAASVAAVPHFVPLAGAAGEGAPEPSMSFIAMLLSAMLGGLLLNLMPCVFPVLAMKALTLLGHANETARVRIGGALAYTAGVLLCFAILGTVLLALRAGGSSVGWGFQLQNPIMVALLVYVLFVAGLNLSGMFEFGGRLMGVGSELAARGGLVGSFFTGVLAAVVATPCTAPFMATALGVALAQPAWIALLTLLALGLGLALPFLLLSVFPGLARALPRPGPWMNTFKQFLAFPLYASVAWLVWVLAQQVGADGVLAVLGGMVALVFALWLWKLPHGRSGARAMLRAGSALAVVLAALLLAWRVGAMTHDLHATLSPVSGEISEPYSRARFEELQAQGKPMFVEFTAAWCITCKVNERLALSGDAFRATLKAGHITYLVGDWTSQDPEISRVLAEFGRAGVPLYVFYPGGGGKAQVLPQILTESSVVKVLAGA